MAAPLGDPIARLAELLAEAERRGAPEPTAMALATADGRGRPSVRMVLLKGLDERGLVFYTNLTSRKAQELRANPRAAVAFWWPVLETQVRVEGPVEPVSDAEADAYFARRPRGSQLGAWASRQSQPLADRAELEARLREVAARFGDGPVPRPPFWSGFRLRPDAVEFWFGRPDRLHERELYTRAPDGGWRRTLLYP